MKITLTAFVLAIVPTLSMACDRHAMSCADGTSYDKESHSCVTVSS